MNRILLPGLLLFFALVTLPLRTHSLTGAADVEEVDRTFLVQIDRSVRNGFGVYALDKRVIIHLHSYGKQPSRWIDAHTGRQRILNEDEFAALRRVYDYDSSQEKGDSYLQRLGCGQWRTCTTLEDADFVVMAREGPSKDQLEFRLVDFGSLLAAFESGLRGDGQAAPSRISPVALEGLREASRTTWRPRLREAMRSIRDMGRVSQLKSSGWLQLLQSSDVMTWQNRSQFPLGYEIDLAECRARAVPLHAGISAGDAESLRTFATVVGECNRFYSHFVNWLYEEPDGMRQQMASHLGRSAASLQSEDLGRLAQFLGFKAQRLAAKPSNGPKLRRPESASSARAGHAQESAALRLEPDDAAEEMVEIAKVPNKIQLLAFDERKGLKLDDSSLAGTIFTARVVNQIADGQFNLVAFNRPNAPVQMRKGKYRVRLKAVLSWVQLQRCEGVFSALYCSTNSRTRQQRTRELEFLLQPSDFRQGQVVSYGQLLPQDLEQSGQVRRTLEEVRLVLELQGITPM